MSNSVPSVLLYSQAIKLIKELQDAYMREEIKDYTQIAESLIETLTQYELSAGKPFLDYDPVVSGEPPSSHKTNHFIRNVQEDIKILEQQVDMLRAAGVFSHNFIKTEINKSRSQNAVVKNKTKTLQMYSDGTDASITTFGDQFTSFENIDLSRIESEYRPALFREGYVTLGRSGSLINLSEGADIRVMSSFSNGFLGNNHGLLNPDSPDYDGEDYTYQFKAEAKNYSDLNFITDGEPDTWIEYENHHLTAAQKREVDNVGFYYKDYSEDQENDQLVDWANGSDENGLRLGLEFDLGQSQTMNYIEYTPYGLEDNINYPVKVKKVQVSADGVDWAPLYPQNVWIGTEVNLQAARTADEVVIGKAVWTFNRTAIRYVQIMIEQPQFIESEVGLVYWVDRYNDEIQEGPIPPVSNPLKYYDMAAVRDLKQRRRKFNGKRWAIGIKDIALHQVNYDPLSYLITKPLRVGGIVDRVALTNVEIELPSGFSDDFSWMRFYLSPNDGQDWFEISRIEDPDKGIPEQIAFNDPTPEPLRERGVGYYDVENVVTDLRLMIELQRPEEVENTTPVLRSYMLKVRRR